MSRRTALAALGLAGILVLTAGSAQATPGALDPTFGTGGTVTTAMGPDNDFCRAVAVQSDGKIIAAGNAWNGSKFEFALARYNTDGSLDSSFGTGGKVTTSFGPNVLDQIGAVVIQPDGKIVAAGSSYNGTDQDFALARYNTDGTLDSSFGVDGKATTAIGAKSEGILGMVLQPDGKIVAAGWSQDSTFTDDFALARYNTNGSLDTSFGSGGKVVTVIGPDHDDIGSVQLQPDGKIVAVGYGSLTTSPAKYEFALVCYNADGSLDSSFGSGGKVMTAIGSLDDEAFGGALQPDGKIVAGGFTKVGSNRYFALARYNADGSLDTGFGSGGKVTTPIGTDDSVNELALQPDGRIVAAGYADTGTKDDFALARYNVNGSLDSGFGSGGTVTTAIGSGSDTASGVALQANGKIVVSGSTQDAGMKFDFAVVRYLGNTLTVAKAGSGTGTVTSSPAGIDCGSSCSAPFAAVSVTLTATAAAGSSLAGWSGGGCTGTGTCTLTVDADKAVTATFEADKTLTVAKSGSGLGTVSSNPAGIACGSTCSHVYAHGTSVTLTPVASSRSKFAGWSGDCSGTGTCTLTMSADHSATARFNVLCIVPKVKGKKLAAAKRAIKRAHCSVGKVTRAYSTRVKRGRVISQKPAPGRKLPAGSKVKLKVSKGKKA